jgi:hypothetical protein
MSEVDERGLAILDIQRLRCDTDNKLSIALHYSIQRHINWPASNGLQVVNR